MRERAVAPKMICIYWCGYLSVNFNRVCMNCNFTAEFCMNFIFKLINNIVCSHKVYVSGKFSVE